LINFFYLFRANERSISGASNEVYKDNVKRLSGKLSDHFARWWKIRRWLKN